VGLSSSGSLAKSLLGEDLDQLMSVLTDHTMLSEEQQELWVEDGNGKLYKNYFLLFIC
jgi:hypothetical protein